MRGILTDRQLDDLVKILTGGTPEPDASPLTDQQILGLRSAPPSTGAFAFTSDGALGHGTGLVVPVLRDRGLIDVQLRQMGPSHWRLEWRRTRDGDLIVDAIEVAEAAAMYEPSEADHGLGEIDGGGA